MMAGYFPGYFFFTVKIFKKLKSCSQPTQLKIQCRVEFGNTLSYFNFIIQLSSLFSLSLQ